MDFGLVTTNMQEKKKGGFQNCWNEAFCSAAWEVPEVEFVVESWVDMIKFMYNSDLVY